jgi:hypothetical protein
MWVNSVPRPPLTEDAFNKWYEEVHIPDIINAKPGLEGCVAAWRYKCQDDSRARPYLALYSIPNMAFVQSPQFGRVSQYHELLPEGGPSQKFVDFDTRFYKRVQVLQKPGQDRREIGRVIKSTAIHPGCGMDEEFDRWYREEHLQQVSQMPGWKKSARFELIYKVQSNDDPIKENAPKCLAIHEFEEGTEVKRIPRELWTEWTKRMVESAVQVDEGTFEYTWGICAENGEL